MDYPGEIIRAFGCKDCDEKWIEHGYRIPGFADLEEVTCPKCKKVVGKIRRDN